MDSLRHLPWDQLSIRLHEVQGFSKVNHVKVIAFKSDGSLEAVAHDAEVTTPTHAPARTPKVIRLLPWKLQSQQLTFLEKEISVGPG